MTVGQPEFGEFMPDKATLSFQNIRWCDFRGNWRSRFLLTKIRAAFK
jgi:hypothetical protein